jgi:hypothetical protein
MASGDSGTASDSSNISSAVGSCVCGAIGSIAGSDVSEQGARLGASVWGAVGEIAK